MTDPGQGLNPLACLEDSQDVPAALPALDPVNQNAVVLTLTRVTVLSLPTDKISRMNLLDIVTHPPARGDKVFRIVRTKVHENPE